MAEKFESVFDAIADSPEDALNMKLRASLIHEIRAETPFGFELVVGAAQHPEIAFTARATETPGHDVVNRQV